MFIYGITQTGLYCGWVWMKIRHAQQFCGNISCRMSADSISNDSQELSWNSVGVRRTRYACNSNSVAYTAPSFWLVCLAVRWNSVHFRHCVTCHLCARSSVKVYDNEERGMCKDDSGALQFGILFRTMAGRKLIKTSVKLPIYPRQLSRVMVILMQRNGTLVNCW
jgi:hypothetical protein